MIVNIKNVGLSDKMLVGEKAALLGEVANFAPVPNGFVIKTPAFQRFVSPHREKIHGILVDSVMDDMQKAERISQMIKSLEIPHDIQKEIADAYEKLGMDGHGTYDVVQAKSQLPVVVRNNMFAQKDESFVESACEINIMGADNLLKAIKQCWADFFTDDLVDFIVSEDLEFDDLKVSVLVQKMVFSHKSGVMYTLNPDSGEENEIAIEACWGLDNFFMLDENEPDFYVVDKASLEINTIDVKTQAYAYLLDKKTGEADKKAIPENEQNIQSLKKEEVVKLASIANKIGNHLGEPVEIEFIIERDNIYVTQISYYEELEDEEAEDEESAEYEEGEPESAEDDDEEYHYDEPEEISAEEFEADIRQMMSKYIAINPSLRNAFEALEKEIIELFKKHTE